MAETSGSRGSTALTLAEVAEIVGGRVVGDPSIRVVGVAPVDEAGPDDLAFLALRGYARYAADSAAGGFLVGGDMQEHVPEGGTAVVVDDAYAALRLLLTRLFPDELRAPGVHPTAVLGRGVTLGRDVHVGPYVVLEDGATLGDRTVVEAHSVVGRRSSVGERSHLYPHVVVYHDCRIGADVIVHAGARIGSDGFGYTFVDGKQRKMPQVGRALIGDEVEIGANTTIDRGSLGDTVVGRGVKIDNLVQVAHNVKVGAAALLAALVGVAGSTRIGKRAWIGGQAGIINQLEIGDEARVTICSVVTRDVPPGVTVSGHPARPHREELHKQAHLGRLPRLVDRVERLEEELRRLKGEP